MLLFLLSGCTGSSVLLVDRAVVKLAAVSPRDGGYEAKIICLTANEKAGAQGEADCVAHLLKGEGATVTDALLSAADAAGKAVFWAQNELLLVDEAAVRSQMDTIIKEFGTERFGGARSYLWAVDWDALGDDADALYKLAVELEAVSRREGKPLYNLSGQEFCVLPAYTCLESGVVSTGCRVWPAQGEPFWLTDEEYALYTVLSGNKNTLRCMSAQNSCTVEDIGITVTPFRDKAGTLSAEISLSGSVYDYEGPLAPESAKEQIDTELSHLFTLFYHDVYLGRKADLLQIGVRMGWYDRAAWAEQEENRPIFRSDTVTFTSRIRLEI